MAEDSTESKTENSIEKTGQTKPAAKAGGNVLTHKIGPLPVWGWFAIALGTYLLYRHFKGSSSSTAAPTVVTGTVGAGGGGATDTGTSTTTDSSIQSGTDWVSAAYQALQNLGYSNATIDDALQKYSTGQPLNATEYGIVEAAIRLVGAAPTAFGTPTQTGSTGTPSPTPTTTAGPTGGPPNLSPGLISAMQANGEYLVSTVYDPTYGDWLYLTQKGGIYALNSSGGNASTGFFGSLFSLPAGTFNGRTAQQLIVNPDGGYTVIDTAGEGYTFGPGRNGSAPAAPTNVAAT